MNTRNQPCACGSGKRFKHCCGALGAVGREPRAPTMPGPARADTSASPYTRTGFFREDLRGAGMAPWVRDEPAPCAPGLENAPPGLLVVDGFLDTETCQAWREYFEHQETTPATIRDTHRRNPDGTPVYRPDKERITEYVPMGALESAIQETLASAFRDTIAPHYDHPLEWMSYPGVLKYRAGGLYKTHADNEHWNMREQRWVRSLDRDYSLLLYINDDYEGGTLYFSNFDVRLTPEAGMLVAFPSDHRYMHAAEPLISGERFAIVSWAAARGKPRLNALPPGAVTLR